MTLQKSFAGLLFIVGLCSGCSVAPVINDLSDNNFNSTLWVQVASEYKANSIQAYNLASINIDRAISDLSWTSILEQDANFSSLPVAVILDIDETVLDNSQYQAQLVLEGTEYNSETWDKWVSIKSAPAIPGSVDFINSMEDKGVEVFYITNRECKSRKGSADTCPQKNDTLDNLKSVGIKQIRSNNLLLRGEKSEWTSEKKSRRAKVAENYRVVMLFGDDLGDFLPDVKKITPNERDLLVYKYQSSWGKKWFLLSNPTYGSWLRVLGDPKSSYLRGY